VTHLTDVIYYPWFDEGQLAKRIVFKLKNTFASKETQKVLENIVIINVKTAAN